MAATTAAPPVSLRTPATKGWFYTGVGVFVFLFCIAAFGPSMVHTEKRSGPSLHW